MTEPSNTKTHKDLFTKHADYQPELNEKLQLLYEGGFKIRSKAELFLERLTQLETQVAYNERCKAIAYIPYLSEFITQFSASLCSESIEVKPQSDASDPSTAGEDMTDDFYKEFLECCDLEGRSYHQFAQDLVEKALDELCVYVTLDFPAGERVNRAQEKAEGLDRGYACVIPYSNVIDWKIDPATGKFLWVKEFEEVRLDDDPLAAPTHYYQFKVRKMLPGKARGKKSMFGGWELWKSAPMPIDKTFTANTKYTRSAVVTTSFPEINLWRLCIKKAYHVGQQIGSLCQEHYQRRSFMVANANKTCVALGVVKLGPEVGAPGDAIPLDLDVPANSTDLRKKLESDGWIVLRKTDKWEDDIEIVEAKGESHKFISEELRHLVESMMQTLRQMNMTASANQKAVGRSAASKQVDQHGTSMLLSAYERVIKDFTKMLFECFAAARGEDIRFAVEGLSIAEPEWERSSVVSEISTLGVDIMKFPDMWKGKYLNHVASALIDNNLTDKERMEMEDKFQQLIESGKFASLDEQEATAAGNKMAQAEAGAAGQGNAQGSTNGAATNGAAGGAGKGGSAAPTPLSKSGRASMPEGAHLQTGQHVDAGAVFRQLADDYDEKDIEFVKHLPWRGPVSVPLSSIDTSRIDKWSSNQPEQADHVQMFADKISNGEDLKPIILVNNPANDSKMQLIDGHHRYLAALKAGVPVDAFIGDVGMDDGPWTKLHTKQNGVDTSQQVSMQKDATKQENKSAEAPNGKTV